MNTLHDMNESIQSYIDKRLNDGSVTLQEVSRTQYQQASKRSDNYAPKNQYNGKNRFERRLAQKVDKSTKELNQINMNKFFQKDTLSVKILVHGETHDYYVTVEFGDVLKNLHTELAKNNGELSLRVIIRALAKSFNGDNIFTHCTCPDYKYRIHYFATQKGAAAGEGENRPSNITNPNNTKGLSCKHIESVLNRNVWINSVAAVILNYVRYMENHYQQLYADIIYPAIYEKRYEEPVQLDFINKGELDSDSDKVSAATDWAKKRTQFKQGNEYRFKPSDNIKGQQEFDFDSLDDTEENV